MKMKQILPVFTLASWFWTVSDSHADITINYNSTASSAIPDGGQLSLATSLSGLSQLSSVTNVVARLNLTSVSSADPMFLGDLYASLTYGTSSEAQRVAVLLNRPGVSNTNGFGSSLSSLNVTFDDSASTNVFNATSATGTYKADGRLGVNPYGAGLAFTAGSNGLSALNGAVLASNRVSLLIADTSQGGSAKLSGWGLSVTGAAASTGTFTPGPNATITDGGSNSNNTVGATLDTTGSAAGGLVLDLAGTMTFTNGATGTGGLLKKGAGELILEGASSYTGATTIDSGTLVVNGTLGSGSAVTVNSGGTLGGSGTVGGTVTVQSGAIMGPGNSPGVLTVADTTTFSTGSMFEWQLDTAQSNPETNRGVAYDGLNTSALAGTGAIFKIMLTGDQSFTDAFWDQTRTWTDIFKSANGSTNLSDWASVFSGGFQYSYNDQNVVPTTQGSFTITGNSLSWSAVPEPSNAIIGLVAAAGLLRRRRTA